MTGGIAVSGAIEHVRKAPAAPVVSLARTIGRHALLLAGLFVLLSALYWAAVYAVGGRAGLPLDDSYIHLQYARSIQQGHSFEYNYAFLPGVPSGGTSAPLWTVMLAGVYGLTGDWLTASYALGVVWTLPCIALTWWLMFRWTGRTAWALFAAGMLLITFPTVVSAFEGMEPSAYTAVFLLGLLCYDFSRTAGSGRQVAWRLAASVVFAVGVWVRPEFLLMPVLIAGERAIALRRGGVAWLGRWLGEMIPQAAVWAVCIAPYLAFNHWVAGTLLPNTYTIKALARNSSVDVKVLTSLPQALMHRDWLGVLLCLTAWQGLMAVSVVIGLLLNNTVLTWKLPRAIGRAWRGRSGRLALAGISLVAFPLVRALVDPCGLFPFQFQRYFAHLTPVLVVLPMAWLARGGAKMPALADKLPVAPGGEDLLSGSGGTAMPDRRLVKWVVIASLVGPFLLDYQAVKAVDNINDMQVDLGRWISGNTPAGSVVAVSDVGAMAFYSQRRVIDAVGLTEPQLGSFYLAGGTLEQYLDREKPQYACLYPRWHDKIARRTDLFQVIYKIDLNKGGLDRNVICGGPSMWVLRTRWNPDFVAAGTGDGPAGAEAVKGGTAPQAARHAEGR